MQTCRIVASARKNTGKGLLSASVAHRTLENVAHERPQKLCTLLRKTVSVLPRALSAADGARGPESSHFWGNMLERSIAELGSGSEMSSKATVAVCGFDKWARAHALVTALLEDPFSSDPAYSGILRGRWKNAPGYVNIGYGKPVSSAGELSSPSDWLRRFPHAIQLIELPNLSTSSPISDETLLNSDVLLLLCDPVATPFSDLVVRARHLLGKPNTLLVLTSGSASDPHVQVVSRTLSQMGCQPGQILFVDPEQALDAVTALQANPTSPSAIDKFQRDTLGSRISTITTAIDETLSPDSKTALIDLRQKTAVSQARCSLSASFRSLRASQKEIEPVGTEISALCSQVHRIHENARHDILGKPGEDDKIGMALSLGAKEMNALLRSLTFWRMVWRIDEIGALVSVAIQGQWCKDLENQLILHTGRLDVIREQLFASGSHLVSASTLASLRSPVLENQLEQLMRLPANVLTPSSLTQPIHHRRNQLIRYTTTKLHREAQSATVGAFGGVFSGAGLSWWLTFGEHVLGLGGGTEVGTAIGSGALLAVGSIRWAVGKWERAKRRWTQDMARVGDGLVRDLQSIIQRTVHDNVTIVASTACKGTQDLVDRRRNEIGWLHRELCDLDAELQAYAGSRKNPPSDQGDMENRNG